jgi:hypothetical protein
MVSLNSDFYTFNDGDLWRHHSGDKYSYFYNEVDSNGTPVAQDSYVTLVLNTQPSVVKNFKTLNYEGNNGWELGSMIASSSDQTLPITKYEFKNNLADLETQFWSNSFKKKENKFFANLINNSSATNGEVLFGPEVSGIKGFWSTVKMKIDWNTTVSSDTNYYTNKKELFSVSSDTVESSY